MKAAFIAAEYNPLHFGHVYHISKTRSDLSPDAVVCIMSGHFTQRGSAAIADKWSRARMALHAGADLVLELHPVYALSSAEGFARGAVATASQLGAGGWLSFGAECPDMVLLQQLSAILAEEPALFKESLRIALDKGESFAAARQKALADCYTAARSGSARGAANADMTRGAVYADMTRGAACGAADRSVINSIIRAPNNILALEYIKAITTLGADLIPHAVQRNRGCPSAAQIRTALYESGAVYEDLLNPGTAAKLPSPLSFLPDYTRALLISEFSAGRGPVFDGAFYPQIQSVIRGRDADVLLAFGDAGEGLHNRIFRSAAISSCYDEFIENAASRRFPKSRVRRAAARALLGFNTDCLNSPLTEGGPPYLRVLGFTNAGRRLLAESPPRVPAVSNFKQIYKIGERAREFMRLEARATDIYAAAFQNPAFRVSGQDYLRGPAVL